MKNKKLKTKLHIETPPTNGLLFGILPALCGRRKPADYRASWHPVDDETRRRANRPFFAEKQADATCVTCRKRAIQILEAAEKNAQRYLGHLNPSDARLLKKLKAA